MHVQYAAPWAMDSHNEAYLRVPDTTFEVAKYARFGPDDQWWYSQWYIANANRKMLGWGLTWNSKITLEYHALNSNTHWLPRKLMPLHDSSRFWLAVGDDADFADTNVGCWVVEAP